MGKGRTGKGAGSNHSASSGICLPQTLEVRAGEEKRGHRARERPGNEGRERRRRGGRERGHTWREADSRGRDSQNTEIDSKRDSNRTETERERHVEIMRDTEKPSELSKYL